ncbi:hypothetical protein [Sphingobacterium faecium]|nr:hypothetical protein [Sphingobacterium faecium]
MSRNRSSQPTVVSCLKEVPLKIKEEVTSLKEVATSFKDVTTD